MQNPDRSETISQNAAYLQRFVIFYSFMSLSLPRVRKRADVCRRTINIKETQKHEKPLNIQGLSYVFHIVKQRCEDKTIEMFLRFRCLDLNTRHNHSTSLRFCFQGCLQRHLDFSLQRHLDFSAADKDHLDFLF